MLPVTVGECEAWVGTHHRGWCPIGRLWVDDGYGNAVECNVVSWWYFMVSGWE